MFIASMAKALPGVFRDACYDAPMNRRPFSERIHADLIFREHLPDAGVGKPGQWHMPEAVFRLFGREARRQQTDRNSLIRAVVCTALTERAEAIRRITAERDRQARDE